MQGSHIEWAVNALQNAGYRIQDKSPEVTQNTPWSTVYCFKTDKGHVYLKKVPIALSIEPQVIQLLRKNAFINVPEMIAASNEHHCFLMQDAGVQLHEYFKTEFSSEILISTLTDYSAIQIASMNKVQDFLVLSVPDWSMNQLPDLYLGLLERDHLLIADGLVKEEINQLIKLAPAFENICERLSQYKIMNTFDHADFHPKNILIDNETKKTTIIDLGEVVITHPFFSLHNCLHRTKESFSLTDAASMEILQACLIPWLAFESQKNLYEIISIIQQCWMIPAALGELRLMDSVNTSDFNTLQRQGRLATKLKYWIEGKD